jgi:predicted cupin superfamily sugar epimerase
LVAFAVTDSAPVSVTASDAVPFAATDPAADTAPPLPYTLPVTPSDIIQALGLTSHPEGGHYVETWRHDGGEADAAEIWHFYAGAPLELSTCVDGEEAQRRVLGPDLAAGQRPQIIVAPHEWQAARSLGKWTLVGCTVSPAFEFEHFELAPEGWNP